MAATQSMCSRIFGQRLRPALFKLGKGGCCGCFLLSLIDRQCGRSRNRMGTETWPERNSPAAENSIGFFSSVRLKLQSYPRIFSSVPKSLRGVSILRNATLSISCDCNGSNQFLCRMNVECIFPFPLFISMRFAVQTKCSSIRPSMNRSRSEEMCSYLHGRRRQAAAASLSDRTTKNPRRRKNYTV